MLLHGLATFDEKLKTRVRLQLVAERCRQEGSPNVLCLPMDVLDLAAHKQLVQLVLTKFKKIDVLVRSDL